MGGGYVNGFILIERWTENISNQFCKVDLDSI
jgi:hypothetical protein